MPPLKRTVPICLFGAALFLGYCACVDARSSNGSEYRELKIEGHGAQPAMSLRVWAEGREGFVSVRDTKGTEVQKLSCTLLRDHLKPTPEEWAATREQFLKQFVLEDFDSDGFVDLAGVREHGAKWARYCVWLFDPKQHLFVKDFLAEQMELLSNLSNAGDGMVSSSSIGPTNPWVDLYRVVGARLGRSERQLLLVIACVVETRDDGKAKAVVVTRYQGHTLPEVQRQPVEGMDVAGAMRKCAGGPR